MDSYTPLLEKTRVPQPSLQKFAVISIFSKLRSTPTHLGPESEPGRDAIFHCLHSSSPAVVDQSVREFCRLVTDSKLDLSLGLVELQPALEGSDPKFVPLFVKALGFVVRVGFERYNGSWKFGSTENHPFVKVLSSRTEVQSELVQQVLLFMTQTKQLGMVEVCEFLRPFFNFSILRIPFSDSLSTLFVRQLVTSVSSICCSFPNDAMPVFKLLIGCLKYFPHKNSAEHKNFIYAVECIVDAYIVVLRHLVVKGLQLVSEAQMCGVELLGTVLSLCTSPFKHSGGIEPIVELLKHVLVAQHDLSLQYKPELSSVILCLFSILLESELEHEHLCILKLVSFLLNWKSEKVGGSTSDLSEELLLIFPIINLMSSPSKSVKWAASDLLVMLENLLVKLLAVTKIEVATKGGYFPISRPESIVFRLLKKLWFEDHNSLPGSFFLTFACIGGSGINQMDSEPRPWTSQLKEYLVWIVDRKKSSRTTAGSQETFSSEMSLLLCAIASVLVMHPLLGNSTVDAFAAIGLLDSKLGVTLLLSILFYINIFTRKDVIYQNMLPKLLGLLPSLASQSAMIPLVVQTILPMLHKDAKPVLYATAIRLLCQTWEINDRTFGSLQGVLNPKGFTEFMSERNICLSMAASIRDVCRKHPDRGVDLILSVSACIESRDPIVQALGFQSLAHLCEADVIDFYTAWDVIAKHVLDYSLQPNLAHSLCLLLRWGAMDAEAYPETSRTVLKILWCVGTTMRPAHDMQWAKARASAFEALTQYEVSFIDKNISDFKQKSLEFLFSETNQDVLQAMEGFQVKIITHEHITRRRFVKEKKVPGSKIEKLLDVLPQVIFSSGKSNAGELPGAALLCISFSPKDLNKQGASRGLQDVHAVYENALVDILPSLQLSRNIFVALLSLQSWKSFMRRWIRANVLSLEAKATNIVLDKTSKAANNILKSMIRITEESIPRSAENMALAIGALCAVLPPSAHTIKSTASKFLLGWLFQHEHEHRQWSAAVSLGLISSSLHATDHKQKFQNINGLLEVLCGSRSSLVRGACGVGLGFSCQDLLTRVEVADDSNLDKGNYKIQEIELLGRIVKVLSLRICQLAPSSCDILENLSAHFPVGSYDVDIDITSKLPHENFYDLEDDIWGVAGLVLGLASSIGVVYRTGAYDAVLKIKDLIISWIPHVNSLVQDSGSYDERPEIVLSVGSCLALPIVVAFCRKVELMDDTELDHLVIGYRELISELLSVNKSGNLYKSLLMASCVGAGSLLACILSEGVHSIKGDHVNCLLQLFKKCYSNPYPPIINLGGMLGVVNALGAGAGYFINVHPSIHAGYAQKEHFYILGPLLSNPLFEQSVTPLMQEIFLVAQNSNDHQLQQYAAWAMSFLRHHMWSKELLNIDNNIQTDASGSKSASHSFSEDSIVMKFCSWLTYRNFSETDTAAYVATVSTVLRCLSRAPRLPTLDWGAIIRRCMRYEAKVANSLPPGSAYKRGTLREECIQFSLVHAKQFDPLLTFLDELSDISRFETLELNLQAFLLFHLADLIKLFSDSRIEKLFDDVADYFSSFTSYQAYNPDKKSFLCISCWKGLYQCLEEASLESLEYISNMEKCMEVLFTLLPPPQSVATIGVNQKDFVQEWSKAVRCLGKARQGWLLDFLQVSHMDPVQGDFQLTEVLKKIQAKAKLVRIGSFSLTELGKLKAYILNFEPLGIWDVLIEVVAALQHADESVKRQWLVDIVEISCVSRYPSTALQFLGLLAGSCCKYMPILILDRLTMLNDLPLILTSLLSDPSWEVVAELFVSYLWVSTERVYNWVTSLAVGESSPSLQRIHESENDTAAFLLQAMHHACVCVKDYLPLEKQLKLTNMVVT
ncbi:protein RST1-like isoform X1 [Pistacia vera]|uniref:protein RST1-like isoform X1 n=1 Tax=Pistacia vera TaxID=55513 RepID=UPI0012639949|nr:protein RST1-like isoform X1 [Pistacia vera]